MSEFLCPGLVPITKESDLAAKLEIGIGVQHVEAASRRASQNILAKPSQKDAFQVLNSILAKSRNMELQDRANTSIGRFLAR